MSALAELLRARARLDGVQLAPGRVMNLIRTSSALSLARALGFSLLGVALAIAASAPRLAHACAAPYVCAGIAAPEGGAIPASAPAIPVVALYQSVSGVAPSPGLALRRADGTAVVGVLSKDAAYNKFFLPASPLTPGAYSMTLENGCSGAPGTTFTVTPSQALPTRVGSLRVAHAARMNGQADTSGGSCVEAIDAGVVDLALELDAQTAPYAPVLAWAMRVDGDYWFDHTGALVTPAASSDSMHSALRLFASCDSGAEGRKDGLAAGIHDVELRATLVGSNAAIAPSVLRVKVTCGADNGEVLPSAADPASTPQVPAPTGTAPPGEGGGSAAPASSASSADSGCSTAPRAPRGGGSALLAAAVVASLIAGRRKTRGGERME